MSLDQYRLGLWIYHQRRLGEPRTIIHLYTDTHASRTTHIFESFLVKTKSEHAHSISLSITSYLITAKRVLRSSDWNTTLAAGIVATQHRQEVVTLMNVQCSLIDSTTVEFACLFGLSVERVRVTFIRGRTVRRLSAQLSRTQS
jgi:hypothetical protein